MSDDIRHSGGKGDDLCLSTPKVVIAPLRVSQEPDDTPTVGLAINNDFLALDPHDGDIGAEPFGLFQDLNTIDLVPFPGGNPDLATLFTGSNSLGRIFLFIVFGNSDIRSTKPIRCLGYILREHINALSDIGVRVLLLVFLFREVIKDKTKGRIAPVRLNRTWVEKNRVRVRDHLDL